MWLVGTWDRDYSMSCVVVADLAYTNNIHYNACVNKSLD